MNWNTAQREELLAEVERLRKENVELRAATGNESAAKELADCRQAMEQLRHDERKYRQLFESMQDAAVFVDIATGIVLDVNARAGEMFGFCPDEMIGRDFRQVLQGCCAPDFDRSWSALSAGHRGSTDMVIQRADDTGSVETPAAMTSSLMRYRDMNCALALFRDISGRKKLERLREDVERMTRHDLKSPLNAVIWLPELIQEEGNLSEEQAESLGDIQRAGRRMLDMINLSMDLYKMESGTYVFRPAAIDILHSIRAVLKEFVTVLHEIDIVPRLTCCNRQVGDDESVLVKAEELLLYSMLHNLFSNALKATTPGCTSPFQVDVTRCGECVDISVRNNGMVPTSVRECFFDKYTTSDPENGSGLGTYSARLMAEVMGGNIEMQSGEGQADFGPGTTVRVRLNAWGS